MNAQTLHINILQEARNNGGNLILAITTVAPLSLVGFIENESEARGFMRGLEVAIALQSNN